MKTRISPTLVGLFVLGALLIAIIAIMSFGGVNLFTRPQRFTVHFDESIHGLDLGSPVKLRGVRVGRVVDMNILYDEATNTTQVAVTGEFNRNIITDPQGRAYDVSDRRRLQAMVDHGLRAELDVLGLATGMLYVELDFAPGAPPPANATATATTNTSANTNTPTNTPTPAPANTNTPYVIIPAKPSTISALQTNITQVLGEIKNMNLPALARDADALLADARRQLATLDLPALTADLTRAAQSITTLANSPEIHETLANLDAAINQLRATLARLDTTLDTTLDPAGEKLAATLAETQATLKKFSDTADTAKRFIDAQTGLGENATRALGQLTEAAASVQRLMDYLERNPNALLTGRPKP